MANQIDTLLPQAQILEFTGKRKQAAQISDHTWLLAVMDELIDYCDEHDLSKTSDKLRRLLGVVVEETVTRTAMCYDISEASSKQ